MKKIFLIMSMLLVQHCLYGQNKEASDPDNKTDWWGDVDGYLNQQAKVTLDLVTDVLRSNPPALKETLTRKMALLLIDNVLHEEKAARQPAIQAFFLSQIGNAIEEIRATKVEEGAVIWKLYNHTFIVKTRSVTIGFDIQRGALIEEGFTLGKELMQKLIDATDVLFVSHMHKDHADEWVAETFLSQNKPVITPTGIWTDSPIYEKVIHPERTGNHTQDINLPDKGLTLKVVIYPGHQGEEILNNVYLVFTPEGLSFSHTGDQSYSPDFVWIDSIRDNYKLDVLMINSWSYYPGLRIAKGFNPKLILPGHENELGHTIDHREPYWLNEKRLGDKSVYPWIQMTWGEKYHYKPASKRN
jgi:L-ascorbate metabolism protein UlaG (beta-lactamase superfamily)